MLGVLLFLSTARADEPYFKKNDVIALVGGEDMVVASEYGYLEALITRALPDYHLRYRNLAWEGDTVYEQRRDINFPTWEEQLDKIGATVVICQFGQMESLDGKEKIPEFSAAYERLLKRFAGDGKRRIIVLMPFYFAQRDNLNSVEDRIWNQTGWLKQYKETQTAYWDATVELANRVPLRFWSEGSSRLSNSLIQRDGIHLTRAAHANLADTLLPKLHLNDGREVSQTSSVDPTNVQLVSTIVAKNKLWFDYWRVENWAFLFGDRTNQPSSRDWRDPSKRWFPAEREEFIPLIEAKEKAIDALAAKLAGK